MVVFYETGDVAKSLGVVPVTVRRLVDRGQLRVAAVTPRGVRLFRPGDVEVLSARRRELRGGLVRQRGW